MTSYLRQLLTMAGMDKRLALVLLGLGLTALIPAVALGLLLVMQVAVTLTLASGIYLLMRRWRRASVTEEDFIETQTAQPLPLRLSRLLDIAFWGIFIASLFLLSREAYARPISFLILVSLMAAILGVEIITNKNTAYCLMKVLVIAILLRASVWYQFPGPVGRDPIIEMDYVRQLIAVGKTGYHMGAYMHYPVAHILTAFTYFATGLELKNAFFVLGIIEAMSLVFLFLIGKELFNEKIGLLAALLMAVSNWHILWGFWMKGMTLGVAWLPILLFFLLASLRPGRGRLPFLIFSMLTILLVILTHTVSSAAILSVLIVIWLSSLVSAGLLGRRKIEQPVVLAIVLLFIVALLGYWVYVSGWILYIRTVTSYAFAADVVLAGPEMPFRNTGVLTMQKLPVLMLIFLTALGCLSIFNIQRLDRKAPYHLWIALAAGGMVGLTFLLYYIGQLGAFESNRWFVFMSLLVAVPAAIGLLSLLGRKRGRSLVTLFLLLLLLSGIMTTANQANIEQVTPWETRTRDAFMNSEIAAARTVSQLVSFAPDQAAPEEPKIYADFLYRLLLQYEFQMSLYRLVEATPVLTEKSAEYDGVLLLRSAVTDVVLLSYEAGSLYTTVEPARYQSLVDDTKASLIYDNGMVKALKRLKPATTEEE